jgi:aspartyl protease family protein
MRSILVIAGLALGASVVVPRYFAHMDAAAIHAAAAARQDAQRGTPVSTNARSVVVPRDDRGHFEVSARVDGRRMDFMVDTGASVIAISVSEAARLGIHPAQSDFTTRVRTANGIVRGAPTRLNMVEVDDLVVRDVAALVLPDGALSDNLLGLSFLSRLRRFEYSEGKLVLEQ